MSKNAKIVIGILILGVVAVGAIGLWASAQRAKQTEAVVAAVVSAKTDARKGEDDTIVTLSYTAAGVPAEGRARVKGAHVGEYPAGRQVRICYDPANTRNLRIDEGSCG